MLETWTHDQFARHVDTDFTAQHPRHGNVTLRLIHVSDLRETPRQRMFSLLFRGPLDQPMEQGGYPLSHAEMGSAALFLVPVGREADGFHYEAVFNNMVN